MPNWYKVFPQFPPNGRDHWRVVMVFHVLLVGTIGAVLLSLINIFYFHSMALALLDASAAVLILLTYVWFRRSGNIKVASGIVSTVVSSLIVLFIYLAKGNANSIIWAAIVPPMTFFLVGRARGTLYSLGTLVFCIGILCTQVGTSVSRPMGIGSVLNVVEASIVIILLFRFYERNRSQAYKQLELRNKQVLQMAEKDPLTGLFNREKFDASLLALQQATQHANADKQFSLVLVDVDHFKAINDTYGHAKGDEVLVGLAKKLRDTMRAGDIVSRWGGEEFALLLPNTNITQAFNLAERLRQEVSEIAIADINITLSLGVATSAPGIAVMELFKLADAALYQAKATGRNKTQIHTHEMDSA